MKTKVNWIIVEFILLAALTSLIVWAPGRSSAAEEPWWSDSQAGLYGGIAGSVIGILGGVIGTLASRGKAKFFVLGTAWTMVIAGVFLVVVGLAARYLGQPYAVYYPLTLLGNIMALVMGINLPGLQKRYGQVELRKMNAQDATGIQNEK